MSTIPYFLRNPNLDDQAQQPMTMTPAAAPQGMAAQVVQHPMHAMIAPIVGAPLRMSTLHPAEDPGQEPAPMGQSEISGVGGDQMSAPIQGTPSAIEPKRPTVRTMSPMERYEDHLAAKQMADYAKDENPYGSDNNHRGVFGKILHGLSVATGGPNRRLFSENQREQQIEGTEKNIGQQALQGAQTGNQQAETNLHNMQEKAAQLVEISPEEAQSIGNPALAGQQVTQAVHQHLLTNASTVQGRQSVAELNNTTKSDIADANNLTKEKLAQLKPEQRDDRAIHIMQKPPEGRTQEENAYLGAYGRWVQQTKVDPGIARAQAFAMFKPVQILGENGDVQYQTAGNAIKSGAATPQSIPFQTAKGESKYMTSGKGGQQFNANSTAVDHLKVLERLASDLGNSDVQIFNRGSQAWAEQTGNPAPVNFDAAKNAMAGEVAAALKASGATDQEIAKVDSTFKRAQSPSQLHGAISTYKELLSSKNTNLQKQYNAGMSGKPAFREESTSGVPKGATHTVPGSDGKMHYTDGKNDLGVVK